MPVTKTTTTTALGDVLVVDLDADSTIENNVTGNSSGSIYLVDVDNTANTTAAVYLRIVDAASAANVAVDHTWLFYVSAGQRMSYVMASGAAYAAGVTMWCTSNPADGDATSPSSAVVVRIVAS